MSLSKELLFSRHSPQRSEENELSHAVELDDDHDSHSLEATKSQPSPESIESFSPQPGAVGKGRRLFGIPAISPRTSTDFEEETKSVFDLNQSFRNEVTLPRSSSPRESFHTLTEDSDDDSEDETYSRNIRVSNLAGDRNCTPRPFFL
jgi:hypothetical protein